MKDEDKNNGASNIKGKSVEKTRKNVVRGRVTCSFCGKKNNPRTHMLIGDHGAVICIACAKAFVDACELGMDEEKELPPEAGGAQVGEDKRGKESSKCRKAKENG